MTVDAARVAPDGSWLRALADTLHLGAVPFGAALFAALVVAFSVWELALGRLAVATIPGDPEGAIHDARVALNHVLCVAYLSAAYVHALRTGERGLAQVGQLLRSEPGLESSLAVSSGRATLLAAGIAGAGAWLLATLGSPGTIHFDPRLWSAEILWHRILGLALGVLGFRLAALLVVQSLQLSRLAVQIHEIDLLDLSTISPFVRQGLTNALLILGFAAAFSVFLVDPGYLWMMISLSVLGAGIAALGLLLPLRGTRRRIQQAKRDELAWCRARLREARRALEHGPGAPTRLDELVAWERRIAEVREWPIDASALRRFVLLLLIPLGSWSGGALVERLIDTLLE